MLIFSIHNSEISTLFSCHLWCVICGVIFWIFWDAMITTCTKSLVPVDCPCFLSFSVYMKTGLTWSKGGVVLLMTIGAVINRAIPIGTVSCCTIASCTSAIAISISIHTIPSAAIAISIHTIASAAALTVAGVGDVVDVGQGLVRTLDAAVQAEGGGNVFQGRVNQIVWALLVMHIR